MNGLDIDSLTEKLASSTVDEEKEISFAGKGLSVDTEEHAAEIVEAIKQCPGMTSLALEGNTFGVSGAKAVAKALESQPNFRKALWKDMFTRRTHDEIPDALQYLSSGVMLSGAKLVELDLSDNAFGPRGLRGIVTLLKSPSCYSLKELRLNNNGLGISGGTMLAEALCDCLANSRKDGHPLKLKLFICGRNRLENDGATKLSTFLKEIGTLEYIAMPQNGIYHPGIQALADAFASNTELKTLNLEDNSLTEKGAEYIANVMPHLINLEVINFGDCLLRTGGAHTMAKSLNLNCPKIKEVLLGFNEINLEGGLAIVNALENKNYLKKLILNGNKFGEDGCQFLEDLVKEYFGKADMLGTLSEDEGAEDDDDDDYDEEEEDYNEEEDYVDNEEEGEYDGTGESLDESQENKSPLKEAKNKSYTSPMLKVSAKDFLDDPTPEKLFAMFKSDSDLMSTLPDEPCSEDYLELFIKVCFAFDPEKQAVKSIACHYADTILTAAFDKCNTEGKVSDFNNLFLVYLGLIKAEDKKFKAPTDLRSPLLVLEHAVTQHYFPKSTRDLLQFFLSRPLKAVEACGKIKHSLMQTLFQQT